VARWACVWMVMVVAMSYMSSRTYGIQMLDNGGPVLLILW
jgi:hypothetical protein